MQYSKKVLENTEIDVCAICFRQDDNADKADIVDWIRCDTCSVWVHSICTTLVNPDEYIFQHCSDLLIVTGAQGL